MGEHVQQQQENDIYELAERLICMAEKIDEQMCELNFNVTYANKMLASFTRICEAGTEVHFVKARKITGPSAKRLGGKHICPRRTYCTC